MALTKTQTTMMALTADDVGERCYVRVTITPLAQQQDLMARAQLIQAFRAPGADGLPFTDDLTLQEMFMPEMHPGTIAERLREQFLPKQSQEIGKLLLAASEQEWLEGNPKLLKKADKRLNPEGLPPIGPEQMQALQRIMQLLQGGADQNVLMQALAQAEGGGTGMMPMPGQPGAVGANPAVMPSQMTMQPEETLPDPVTLPGKQARRGREAN